MANSKPNRHGSAGARKTRSRSRKGFSFRRVRNLGFLLLLSLFLLSLGWVLLYKWVDPPVTMQMIKRRAEAGKAEKLKPYIQYRFVNLSEVSDEVPLAVMAAEDQRFLVHHGFDFGAMQQAFKKNLDGKRIRGGSTISQQVAKNVFLWHGRSYFRKGVEAYFTFLIELFWSKRRIMEVYLNIAEMGDQVFGIEAAARTYYRTDPINITRRQAASIAAVLPNPVKYSVTDPGPYVSKNRNRIVKSMKQLGGTKFIEPLKN
jgi:monofunctional glycosyltransferase